MATRPELKAKLLGARSNLVAACDAWSDAQAALSRFDRPGIGPIAIAEPPDADPSSEPCECLWLSTRDDVHCTECGGTLAASKGW